MIKIIISILLMIVFRCFLFADPDSTRVDTEKKTVENEISEDKNKSLFLSENVSQSGAVKQEDCNQSKNKNIFVDSSGDGIADNRNSSNLSRINSIRRTRSWSTIRVSPQTRGSQGSSQGGHGGGSSGGSGSGNSGG